MTDRATTKRNPRKEPAAPPAVERREVTLGWNLRHDTNRAEAVLAESGEVYRKGSRLVRVQESDSGPEIVAVSPEFIREVLSANAQWLQNGVPVSPPDEVIAALMARGWWPSVPQIEAVVEFSALRPDGSILFEPGYDALTQVLYRPNADFPRPDVIDEDAVLDAAAKLGGPIDDFPFETAVDRAVWIAALLTVAGRHAFSGPAPIFLIEGQAGSGKSLLAELVNVIATGRPGRPPAPFSAGGPVALADNWSGVVTKAWADAALASGQLVIVAGENLEVEPGAARRCLRIRLHSPVRWPDRRNGFEHRDLLDHVRRERPALVASALSIVKGFVQAGEPREGLTDWGVFDGWSFVRGAMLFAGLPDPIDSNSILRTEVEMLDELQLAILHENWVEVERVHRCAPSIPEALELFALGEDLLTGLRDSLAILCGQAAGRLPNPRSIQRLFESIRGRVVGGRSLEFVGNSPRGRLYSVRGEEVL